MKFREKGFCRWKRRYAIVPTLIEENYVWLEWYWVRNSMGNGPIPSIIRTQDQELANLDGEELAIYEAAKYMGLLTSEKERAE